MTMRARDVMVTEFDKIHAEESARLAIEMILNGRVRKTGHKTVSLIVVDDLSELAGVVTLFDILYHLRPDFLNYGYSGDFISWEGQLRPFIEALKKKKVKQIMSPEVMGASPDEHLMTILDRMVKNKYRRLPVIENNKPIGIVYIADVYHHLFSSNPG
ncbi:MAG TPA: CBS domain-containing protein [Desulfobacterales bacterium]|jgi:CBS domain-containing protein|nr:CBS domain-containing protein [Desulfobacterales bacterium]